MKQVKNAALAAATVILAASAASTVSAQEVYVQGGTLGAGVGAALPLSSWAGVHAELEGFGLSHSVTVDGNVYDGRLTLLQGGLYLDLFPFSSSGFRVTAGALINNDELKAHAVANSDGNYKIGNSYVPAVGAAPSATAEFPHVMPYLGIGYGHKPVSKGFGVTFDLGVAYGRPHVDYSVPQIYTLFTTQANIDQEEQKLNNDVARYRWYPVAQIGVTYRF
ncbi:MULTISPECIES: hypothetical protein [Paraburkholderia]|uniref:Outer membrane protein n=1 Tax=Paraburkholderia phenazinium TaxID=60549 RepID=A0A1N6K1L7_9BURK|nr:hypothetical protein [Paraburkholderia phenazinium]SIO50439.1 hypothetical protein SAMN05444168_5759 [Paraburkholderia phenazinium]